MSTIIFKPTEKCNSNCVYCDVVVKKAPKTMSIDLLELCFKKMNDYLLEEKNEKLTLIWHGGEPMLLGIDYFKKAIEFLNIHCKETKHLIQQAIQSNLTMMKQEYIEVFREMGIQYIGTSYEPISNIRGIGKDTNSALYNKKFFEGVNILADNNFGWGFIYVVTKKALSKPLDVFYFLSNLKLSGGFMMNPVLIYGDDKNDLAITPQEYVDFLGEIFPVWWKNRFRYEGVEPFKSIVKNVVEKGQSLGCVDSGACAHEHMYIGPSGETSQCGRSEDWGIVNFGNIADRSLKEIFSDPKREEFNKRTNYLFENDCAGCRFWKICHGGCPLDSYAIDKEGLMRKTAWCDVKKIFMEKYFEPITGIKFNT